MTYKEREIRRKIADIELALCDLKQILEEDNTGRASLDEIVHFAAVSFGLNVEHVLDDNRRTAVVSCRAAAINAALELGYSLSAIGRALKKDHTTIIFYRDGYLDRLRNYPEYRDNMLKVEAYFKPKKDEEK